jgi:hypothetical protein
MLPPCYLIEVTSQSTLPCKVLCPAKYSALQSTLPCKVIEDNKSLRPFYLKLRPQKGRAPRIEETRPFENAALTIGS